MSERAIGYASGISIVASLGVLFAGMCLIGFDLGAWPEWQGRIVGIAGTIAGIAGAVIGLRIALRAERHTV